MNHESKNCLYVIFVLTVILSNLAYGELTNIQYEGRFERASMYDRFAVKDNHLYTSAGEWIENYQILDNGDLELCDYIDVSGLVNMHIAGDSLYIITGESHLAIIDISMNTLVPTEIYSLARPCDWLGANDRYVIAGKGTGYYYDRYTHTFGELSFQMYQPKALMGNYLFDFFWDVDEQVGKTRIRDISNLDNPDTLYIGKPTSEGPPWTWIEVLDSLTIAFSDDHTNTITFYDFSTITDPEFLSFLEFPQGTSMGPSTKVGDTGYLFYAPRFSGARYLYNIEDLTNPSLVCAWNAGTQAVSSIAYEHYIYTARGWEGIAKYDVNLLPITEPLDFFGNRFHYAIYSTFDGERVITYERDKIITRTSPDEEEMIIYQDLGLDYYNGGFCCNDSLVIVKIRHGSSSMDLRLIETATGELKNSYDNFEYHYSLVYVEPYFYFYTYGVSPLIKVYEVDKEWNLNLVTTLDLYSPIIYIGDCPENYVWITTQGAIYIYDTEIFEQISVFPYSVFAPSWAGTPYPDFFNDLLYIRYGDNQTLNRYARLYSFDFINNPVLIDLKDWGEYRVLYLVEDTIISARLNKPAFLSLFSPGGFNEPYGECTFAESGFMSGTLSWIEKDEANDRIFVRKTNVYESYTYDYAPSVPEQPDIEEGITISNFPNPFSTSTTISFNLHHRDTENAEIKIYNIKGQLIRQFNPPAGGQKFKISGEAIWDGRDSFGKPVPSGVYLYRITTDSFTSETKKMILIK